MRRITEKDLEIKVQIINEKLRRPQESWIDNGEKYVAQIGNFHLGIEGGGYHLQEMHNESGAIKRVLYAASKRELFNLLSAFIDGLRFGGVTND